MKYLKSLFIALLVSSILNAQDLQGAWMRDLDTAVQYMTIVDNYFVVSTFHIDNKKFIRTRGGRINIDQENITGVIEFNTDNKDEVKLSFSYNHKLKGKKLHLPAEGISHEWTRVDDGTTGLSGNWQIVGRHQNGNMVPMNPGARKTIKIMSGTRFQWAAINAETGEFFGTGGGTYTFKDGQYTEQIEFFSRDASRVGASLSFDAEIKDGDWHHKGKSSKGDPIHEVWSRKHHKKK
jgi:hypothetical protein